MTTTATSTADIATFDMEWEDDRDLIATHISERAARVYDRLESKGALVMDVVIEDWRYVGKVNTRKTSGTPYFHFLYERSVIMTAIPEGTSCGDDEHRVAVSVTVHRYGKNGAIRDGEIVVGAPYIINFKDSLYFWSQNADNLKARGYRRHGFLISILTEGPVAHAARRSIGFKG